MCSGVKTRARFCFGLYVLALAGCEDEPPRPEMPATAPEQPSPPKAPAAAPNLETPAEPEDLVPRGSELPAPSARERLVNFAEEAARFSTLEACVAAIPSRGPLLSDALEELGLASLARDSCHLIEAVHARSAEPCKAVSLGVLATRCLVAAAVARSEAEACPAVDAHDPTRGRDALCLALASRRTQPCDALEASDAITCRATTRQERALCKESPTAARRQACARSVERWRGLVGPVAEAPEHAPRAQLDRPDGSRAFDALAVAGAVVVDRAGKRRIAVDVARARTRLKLRLRVDAAGAAELEVFELTEGGIVVAHSGPLARASVTFHERDGGAAEALTVVLKAGGEAEGFTSFTLTTPVRDRIAGAP